MSCDLDKLVFSPYFIKVFTNINILEENENNKIPYQAEHSCFCIWMNLCVCVCVGGASLDLHGAGNESNEPDDL